MEYQVSTVPDATEIARTGQLSFSDHEQFRRVLDKFKETASHRIVFNISRLEFADSAGLGMFIIARDEAEKRGLKFTISGARSRVKELMDLAKFDRIFDLKP